MEIGFDLFAPEVQRMTSRGKRRIELVALLGGLLLGLFAVGFIASGTAEAANRALLGQFGAETGEAGGQLRFGSGVAVNRTGAGGVSPGAVYVPNFSNARVEQFSAEGNFVRAFGLDVVRPGGEHDTGSAGVEVCEAVSSPPDICKEGGKVENAGSVRSPEGIALDNATGNVFLASAANRRIDIFTAKGAFEGAFGWGVQNGAAAFQFCTLATTCRAAASTAGAGGFASLAKAALAIDPSNGHLYVGDRTNRRINEFSLSLNGSNEVVDASFVRAFGWDVVPGGATELETCTTTCQAGTAGGGNGQFPTNTTTGIAVNSTGLIYAITASNVDSGSLNTCTVAIPCRVQVFNPDGTFKETFGPSAGGAATCQLTWTSGAANGEAADQIAIDPANNHVFITRKASATGTVNLSPGTFEVCEFDSAGVLVERFPSPALETNNTGLLQPAVASNGLIYVNAPLPVAGGATSISILGVAPPSPGAVALDATNITENGARLNGEVKVPAPGGPGYKTTYRFEFSADKGDSWINIPAPDASAGSTAGSVHVSEDVEELQPNQSYRFRLVATNAAGTVTSVETKVLHTTPAAPTIAHTRALPVSDTSATLRATVNPNNSPTMYYFRWGATAAYGSEAPESSAFAGDAGQPLGVFAGITGLQPGTVYHFQLVASNGTGTTYGPDLSFRTNACPTSNAWGLPDCRRLELVSPGDQGPVGEATARLGETDVQFQTTDDGSRLAYQLSYGLADSTAGAEVLYRAERSDAAWASTQLTPPALVPFVGGGGGAATGVYQYLSEDLSCGFVASIEPLTDDAPSAVIEAGGNNLFRLNPDGTYTVVTSRPPEDGTVPGVVASLGGYIVLGAAPDCSRVVFAFAGRYPGLSFSGLGTVPGLYEWDEGSLRTLGVIPGPLGPTVATPALAGGAGGTGAPGGYYRAVSDDASRVYFNATSLTGGDVNRKALFLQEGGATARDVSQSDTGIPNLGARFQTASRDGLKVFFLANYGLTADQSRGAVNSDCSASGTLCDLYEYDVQAEVLKDLTATSAPANPDGAVVEGVLDASEDGDYVYIAAKGELIPGQGRSYVENTSGGGSYNIYLLHAGQKSFVATVPAGGKGGLFVAPREATLLNNWSSRATPSGKQLIFQSVGNVTGYDGGGVLEAYRYDAVSDTTVCVSCRTDGKPSVGTAFTSPLAVRKGGAGLVDILHPRRSITVDGSRVFFNARDALAPGAVDGNVNLYQWERGQVSLLATRAPRAGEVTSELNAVEFVGASADGDSVFFSTPERLLPQDGDGRRSIYVAKVGGGFDTPPPTAPPCSPLSEGSCQGGGPTPTGVVVPPASMSVSGPGNEVPAMKKQSKKKKTKKKRQQRAKKDSQRRHRSADRGAGQ